MKLNYFSEQTLPKMGGGSKAAKVSFGKSGVISFNRPACELMALKAGDKVTLCQDEQEPRNWYFFKDPTHGFELRAGYKDNGCMFNHRQMVESFLRAFELATDISHGFKLGKEATVLTGSKTKYWGILVPA